MKKDISKANFNGTKEQEQKLIDIIKSNKKSAGSLLPILQEAQTIYGYLPLEVQTIISRELNVPLQEVFSVSTFYSQFSLVPKGKYNISICLGTACYVKGSKEILKKVGDNLGINPEECTKDGEISLTACRCVGACASAPVMTINEDVYSKVTLDQVDSIISKYKSK